MNRLDEVIQKAKELNSAIEKLNNETKVMETIVAEKTDEREKQIVDFLNRYKETMIQLKISEITIPINTVIYYYGLSRLAAIRLRIFSNGKKMQIDLGVYGAMSDFYARHSMGYVISGVQTPEIFYEFCNKWKYIEKDLDNSFANEVEKILQKRKDDAIAKREKMISRLTAIGN